MSDFLADLSNVLTDGASLAGAVATAKNSTNKRAGADLEMVDFLSLMVAGFQNQSIDDVASTSEMMNQMMQMSVIQAVNSLTNLITQSTSLSYAASLVGKEVTIGQNINGELVPLVGTVTGTGTVSGQQVVFVNGESYYLTDIMAVGRLPGDEKAPAAEETEEDNAQKDPMMDENGIIWPGQMTDGVSESESAESAGTGGQAAGAGQAESEQAKQQPEPVYNQGFAAVTGDYGQALPTIEMMEAAAENMYESSL